jgi:hypothetical protein
MRFSSMLAFVGGSGTVGRNGARPGNLKLAHVVGFTPHPAHQPYLS